MDIDHLAEAIFVSNRSDLEMTFDLNQWISGKQLAHMLYTLFMKGLVLLYGEQHQKITLNRVTQDQVDHVCHKLRLAHIKTIVEIHDKESAILLDYIPENTKIPLELYVIHENQKGLMSLPDNTNIREYVFQLFMNGRLIRVSFDILRSLR